MSTVDSLTYEQASEVLGLYLEAYLNSGHLKRRGGFYENPRATNEDDKVIHGADVISLESVRKMADYLYASEREPDLRIWPKETEHWQKPKAETGTE